MKISSVNTRHGVQHFLFEDDTIGASLSHYGEWAHTEQSIMLSLVDKGANVVDAGCNVGYHTMGFANAVGPAGHVFAFDPQAEVLDCAIQTSIDQKRRNISFVGLAISNSPSFHQFSLPEEATNNFGAARISQTQTTPTETRRIFATSLDALGLDDISCVKMDIEGHELSALAGSIRIIETYRPVFFLEANSPAAATAVNEWFVQHSYVTVSLVIKAFNPKNYLKSRNNIFGDASERLIVCLPREEKAKLRRLKLLIQLSKQVEVAKQ